MKQKRILVPTQSAQDWKRLLAEPEKHWKPGYSAILMAQSWEIADVQLYGKTPVKGSVIFLTNIDHIRLYSGWVYTEPPGDTPIKRVL
jgi:hypothetical protein